MQEFIKISKATSETKEEYTERISNGVAQDYSTPGRIKISNVIIMTSLCPSLRENRDQIYIWLLPIL